MQGSYARRILVDNGDADTNFRVDFPALTTAGGYITFFRNTNTTGGKGVQLFKGDRTGTITTYLRANGNSYFNVGNLGIGATSPIGKIHTMTNLAANVPIFERLTGAETTQAWVTARFVSQTTGVVANSFGAALRFAWRDSGTVITDLAEIQGIRDGADNSGAIVFAPHVSGGATERMRIRSDGNVGIGTTTTTAKLSVNGVIQGASDFSAAISSDTSAKFGMTDRVYMQINRVGTASGGYLGFYTSVTSVGTVAERMRIIESGNVGIGTATPNQALEIGGTGTLRIAGAAGGTGTPAIIDGNGDLRPQTSSERFKHAIADLDFDPTLISQMRAVQYLLNSDNSADFGFIAEELARVYPLAVNFDKEGHPYSVKYGQITVLLTKGWQYHEQRLAEQSETISKQTKTIDAQARALASHEATIAEMKSSMAFFQKENEELKERMARLEAMVEKLI